MSRRQWQSDNLARSSVDIRTQRDFVCKNVSELTPTSTHTSNGHMVLNPVFVEVKLPQSVTFSREPRAQWCLARCSA